MRFVVSAAYEQKNHIKVLVSAEIDRRKKKKVLQSIQRFLNEVDDDEDLPLSSSRTCADVSLLPFKARKYGQDDKVDEEWSSF